MRNGPRLNLRGEGSVHGLVRVLTGLGGEGEGVGGGGGWIGWHVATVEWFLVLREWRVVTRVARRKFKFLGEWIVRKGNQAPAAAYGIVFFWKLESLERNVLRSFQIGPLEAWENVIQRGTTCLWEHLKYGVWILSYNVFHRNCFLISQIGKPLYIIYLPLPSSDWNDQGELFSTNFFFSKNFPMEKSMKNEKFDFFFDQHFFRNIFLWKSQWKMKILIFREKKTPGEDLQ